MPAYVLVPSALLGPATWAPVASALEARGEPLVIAPVDAVADAAAALEAVVLVPHSNAGYRASDLAATTGAVAAAIVDLADRVGSRQGSTSGEGR